MSVPSVSGLFPTNGGWAQICIALIFNAAFVLPFFWTFFLGALKIPIKGKGENKVQKKQTNKQKTTTSQRCIHKHPMISWNFKNKSLGAAAAFGLRLPWTKKKQRLSVVSTHQRNNHQSYIWRWKTSEKSRKVTGVGSTNKEGEHRILMYAATQLMGPWRILFIVDFLRSPWRGM